LCDSFSYGPSSQVIVSMRPLQYHISNLLLVRWISVIYVKNSTFGNYTANPLHKTLVLLETQAGISLIQKIIVRPCQISTSIARALLHSKYLQTKAVNCVVCFGVAGWRLWIRTISLQSFLRNTFQGSCISDVVAGRHLNRASHILRSHSNPLQEPVEHYVRLRHSQIEARVTSNLSWAQRLISRRWCSRWGKISLRQSCICRFGVQGMYIGC